MQDIPLSQGRLIDESPQSKPSTVGFIVVTHWPRVIDSDLPVRLHGRSAETSSAPPIAEKLPAGL